MSSEPIGGDLPDLDRLDDLLRNGSIGLGDYWRLRAELPATPIATLSPAPMAAPAPMPTPLAQPGPVRESHPAPPKPPTRPSRTAPPVNWSTRVGRPHANPTPRANPHANPPATPHTNPNPAPHPSPQMSATPDDGLLPGAPIFRRTPQAEPLPQLLPRLSAQQPWPNPPEPPASPPTPTSPQVAPSAQVSAPAPTTTVDQARSQFAPTAGAVDLVGPAPEPDPPRRFTWPWRR